MGCKKFWLVLITCWIVHQLESNICEIRAKSICKKMNQYFMSMIINPPKNTIVMRIGTTLKKTISQPFLGQKILVTSQNKKCAALTIAELIEKPYAGPKLVWSLQLSPIANICQNLSNSDSELWKLLNFSYFFANFTL